MKEMGAKKVAAVGYGISASSTAVGEEPPEVRGARARASRPSTPTPPSTSAAPTSDPQVLGDQELRCRRRLPAARRRLQHRDRAGPRPERREDEVHRAGHRLRPARSSTSPSPRPSGPKSSWSPRTARWSSRPRRPSSSRPTSRSTPATPACPTTASTPATSPATWPSWAWRTRART